MSKSDIWTFKYEPKSFDDIILNSDIRPKLQKAMKEIPNLLLYCKPGVGKGTFTHIFLKETGLDYLWVNASDERGIDVMRDKIKSFATALGISGIKVVVLNEGDALTTEAQGMLKQLIEDVHKITRFIFLANYEHPFIPEIKSRCQVIEISNPPGADILKFCEHILKSEGVEYDRKTVVSIIKKCHPDIRSIIWRLQENTIDGILKSDMISRSESTFLSVLEMMKKSDIEGVRKFLRSNTIDYIGLYEYLFENVGEFKSPGDAIIEIGEHLYRNDSMAIKEINFVHMFVKMMKGNMI
jgi:replication factor C small subunit